MKLMGKLYLVREHKEKDNSFGDYKLVEDKELIEEKCFIESDDYLDIGNKVYEILDQKISISDLYTIREVLNEKGLYIIDSYKTDSSVSFSKFAYCYNGVAQMPASIRMYLMKQWTIEK